MKKTYNIPTLTVVKIQPARILAGSEQAGMNGAPITDPSGFGTRRGRFSGWDEDFDDEE